jgi:flavin-dependent thymidylate synthase
MKVSLIDYTGIGHSDPLFAARLLAYTKNTRLEQSPEGLGNFMEMLVGDLETELAYIANTIRSSWEFVDFTFQIVGVTRAFTHQLVRTRTASYAQQSQRSINVVGEYGFGNLLPETVKAGGKDAMDAWQDAIGEIKESYVKLQSLGIPNQDCRGLLPTNVLTNIIIKMNLRTLADLLAKRKNLRAQGEYADVARAMETAALEVMPWIDRFINPERLRTPKLDALLAEALGSKSPIDMPEINAALKELDALKGTWG